MKKKGYGKIEYKKRLYGRPRIKSSISSCIKPGYEKNRM